MSDTSCMKMTEIFFAKIFNRCPQKKAMEQRAMIGYTYYNKSFAYVQECAAGLLQAAAERAAAPGQGTCWLCEKTDECTNFINF